MAPKSVCFDVLGTCFGFDAAIKTIDERLGAKLRQSGLDPKTLFFSWFYAAQRDFTYTSVVDAYTPIAQILQQTFRRACLVVDFTHPITDEDVAAVMDAVKKLEARPGLKSCYDGLRESGWDVYGVTNGGHQTSLGYYKQAGVDLDEAHCLSCDDLKVAKPDVKVYESAKGKVEAAGCSGEGAERWFVAAHAWDLIAARKAGFRTAYLDFEEHDPVTAIFGEFDIYANSMSHLLEKMKKA